MKMLWHDYGMVIYDPVAVVSCGGLWFGSLWSSHIWRFSGGHDGGYNVYTGGSYRERYGGYGGYGAGGGSGAGHSYDAHDGYCRYDMVGGT